MINKIIIVQTSKDWWFWWDVEVEVKGAGAAFPNGIVCSYHTIAQSGVP